MLTLTLSKRFPAAVFVLIVCLVLNACSGGGGGGSTPAAPGGGGGGGVTPPTTVSGVAATGAPLALATVTLKDQNGVTKTKITDALGAYSIDITGLTPPFLLQVVSANGTTTLFSAASAGGTANIHPFTNLAVQTYYQAALGTPASSTFAVVSSSSLLPSQTDLGNLATTLNGILGPTLLQVGVSSPGAFNIFSTAFTANQPGFDQLLQNTQFTGLNFVVTTGTLTQNVTVTAGSGAISFANATSDTGTATSSSSSSNVTIAATTQQQQSAQQAAVTAIQTLWTNLAAIANSKGSSLTAADIAPFVDVNYLDRGVNATVFKQNVANTFKQGVSITSIGPVYNFTEANNQTLISAAVTVQVGTGNSSVRFILGGLNGVDDGRPGWIYIKQTDGSFKLFGDQSIAYMNLFVNSGVNYTSAGASAVGTSMIITAHAPFATPPSNNLGIGTVSSVTVANTGTNALLPTCSGNQPFALNRSASMTLTEQQTVIPPFGAVAVTDNGDEVFQDAACTGTAISSTPPAGTTYNVTFTPVAGAANNIAAQIHSQSNEAAHLVTINGVNPGTFLTGKNVANVTGTQFALAWALPTTFAVENVSISTSVIEANGSSEETSTELGPIATSGSTIAIPAALSNGHPTTQVRIGLFFFGVNGERISASFTIQ